MNKISVVLPILIPDEFCRAMTEFCIRAMRAHAQDPFELVIVETGSEYFRPRISLAAALTPDIYLHRPAVTTYVADWNAGADLARGDFLVHIGNDVFLGPDWQGAFLEPFIKAPDCGMTSTSVLECGSAVIGVEQALPGVFVEGWFTASMCFRKEWRLDSSYKAAYSDSDLIMRMYTAGLRAYRSYRSVAHHLLRVTWKRTHLDGGEGQTEDGEKIFYDRWSGSPLWAYAMIRAPRMEYGREHMARLSPTPPEIRIRNRQNGHQ